MAVTYRSHDKVDNVGGTTSVVGNKPAGVAQGDGMVAALYAFAPSSVTAPSGWTLLQSLDATHSGGDVVRLWVYFKQAGLSEPSTYTWTFGSATDAAVAITAYTAPGPIGVNVSANNPQTAISLTDIIAPSITATQAPSRLVSIWTTGRDVAGTFTVPASMTERFDLMMGSGGSGATMALADEALAATGATGTRTAVTSQSAQEACSVSLNLYETNTAPNAPIITTMTAGAIVDLSATNRADWDFSDPDAGDSQSKFDLRYRVVGAGTWTEISQTIPNTFYDFVGGTFTANDYEWQVRTYDAFGEVGPYSASSFFTAATVAADLSITAPTNGATISTSSQLVEWSTPTQTHYQVRVVADLAGAPDTSNVIYDTGEIESAGTRSLLVEYPTTGVTRHTQVRKKSGGLWTAWVSVSNPISYTTAPTPTITVDTTTEAGAVQVQATHPTPTGSEPAVSSIQVYRRPVDDTGDGIRVATDLAALAVFTDWFVASGVEYAYRVKAVGDNGTSAFSAWSEDGSGTVEPVYYGGTYPDGMYGSEGGGY